MHHSRGVPQRDTYQPEPEEGSWSLLDALDSNASLAELARRNTTVKGSSTKPRSQHDVVNNDAAASSAPKPPVLPADTRHSNSSATPVGPVKDSRNTNVWTDQSSGSTNLLARDSPAPRGVTPIRKQSTDTGNWQSNSRQKSRISPRGEIGKQLPRHRDASPGDYDRSPLRQSSDPRVEDRMSSLARGVFPDEHMTPLHGGSSRAVGSSLKESRDVDSKQNELLSLHGALETKLRQEVYDLQQTKELLSMEVDTLRTDKAMQDAKLDAVITEMNARVTHAQAHACLVESESLVASRERSVVKSRGPSPESSREASLHEALNLAERENAQLRAAITSVGPALIASVADDIEGPADEQHDVRARRCQELELEMQRCEEQCKKRISSFEDATKRRMNNLENEVQVLHREYLNASEEAGAKQHIVKLEATLAQRYSVLKHEHEASQEETWHYRDEVADCRSELQRHLAAKDACTQKLRLLETEQTALTQEVNSRSSTRMVEEEELLLKRYQDEEACAENVAEDYAAQENEVRFLSAQVERCRAELVSQGQWEEALMRHCSALRAETREATDGLSSLAEDQASDGGGTTKLEEVCSQRYHQLEASHSMTESILSNVCSDLEQERARGSEAAELIENLELQAQEREKQLKSWMHWEERYVQRCSEFDEAAMQHAERETDIERLKVELEGQNAEIRQHRESKENLCEYFCRVETEEEDQIKCLTLKLGGSVGELEEQMRKDMCTGARLTAHEAELQCLTVKIHHSEEQDTAAKLEVDNLKVVLSEQAGEREAVEALKASQDSQISNLQSEVENCTSMLETCSNMEHVLVQRLETIEAEQRSQAKQLAQEQTEIHTFADEAQRCAAEASLNSVAEKALQRRCEALEHSHANHVENAVEREAVLKAENDSFAREAVKKVTELEALSKAEADVLERCQEFENLKNNANTQATALQETQAAEAHLLFAAKAELDSYCTAESELRKCCIELQKSTEQQHEGVGEQRRSLEAKVSQMSNEAKLQMTRLESSSFAEFSVLEASLEQKHTDMIEDLQAEIKQHSSELDSRSRRCEELEEQCAEMRVSMRRRRQDGHERHEEAINELNEKLESRSLDFEELEKQCAEMRNSMRRRGEEGHAIQERYEEAEAKYLHLEARDSQRSKMEDKITLLAAKVKSHAKTEERLAHEVEDHKQKAAGSLTRLDEHEERAAFNTSMLEERIAALRQEIDLHDDVLQRQKKAAVFAIQSAEKHEDECRQHADGMDARHAELEAEMKTLTAKAEEHEHKAAGSLARLDKHEEHAEANVALLEERIATLHNEIESYDDELETQSEAAIFAIQSSDRVEDECRERAIVMVQRQRDLEAEVEVLSTKVLQKVDERTRVVEQHHQAEVAFQAQLQQLKEERRKDMDEAAARQNAQEVEIRAFSMEVKCQHSEIATKHTSEQHSLQRLQDIEEQHYNHVQSIQAERDSLESERQTLLEDQQHREAYEASREEDLMFQKRCEEQHREAYEASRGEELMFQKRCEELDVLFSKFETEAHRAQHATSELEAWYNEELENCKGREENAIAREAVSTSETRALANKVQHWAAEFEEMKLQHEVELHDLQEQLQCKSQELVKIDDFVEGHQGYQELLSCNRTEANKSEENGMEKYEIEMLQDEVNTFATELETSCSDRMKLVNKCRELEDSEARSVATQLGDAREKAITEVRRLQSEVEQQTAEIDKLKIMLSGSYVSDSVADTLAGFGSSKSSKELLDVRPTVMAHRPFESHSVQPLSRKGMEETLAKQFCELEEEATRLAAGAANWEASQEVRIADLEAEVCNRSIEIEAFSAVESELEIRCQNAEHWRATELHIEQRSELLERNLTQAGREIANLKAERLGDEERQRGGLQEVEELQAHVAAVQAELDSITDDVKEKKFVSAEPTLAERGGAQALQEMSKHQLEEEVQKLLCLVDSFQVHQSTVQGDLSRTREQLQDSETARRVLEEDLRESVEKLERAMRRLSAGPASVTTGLTEGTQFWTELCAAQAQLRVQETEVRQREHLLAMRQQQVSHLEEQLHSAAVTVSELESRAERQVLEAHRLGEERAYHLEAKMQHYEHLVAKYALPIETWNADRNASRHVEEHQRVQPQERATRVPILNLSSLPAFRDPDSPNKNQKNFQQANESSPDIYDVSVIDANCVGSGAVGSGDCSGGVPNLQERGTGFQVGVEGSGVKCRAGLGSHEAQVLRDAYPRELGGDYDASMFLGSASRVDTTPSSSPAAKCAGGAPGRTSQTASFSSCSRQRVVARPLAQRLQS